LEKIYCLDTNVLVESADSIFSFKNHEVVIPFTSLIELDGLKTRADSVGQNARRCIRHIDKLREQGSLVDGISINEKGVLKVSTPQAEDVPRGTSGARDSDILQSCQKIAQDNPDKRVILISNDINMRIFADVLGFEAEGFLWDGQPQDDDVLYTGATRVKLTHDQINSFYENREVDLPDEAKSGLYPNQFLIMKNNGSENPSAIAKYKHGAAHALSIGERSEVWGLAPRNKEQRFALDLLMDNNISLVSLIGRAGCGKAQPIDSKILTPKGWVPMGSIEPGQLIMSPNGNAIKVIDVFPQGIKPVYKVIFSDGSTTECCDEHLWLTYTQKDRDSHREGTVKSLAEIRTSLKYGSLEKRNHSIPMTKPVNLNKKVVPIDPYFLGLLLGDGCMSNLHAISMTTADAEILDSCMSLLPSGLCMKQCSHDDISYRIVKEGARNNKPNILIEHLKKLELAGHKSEHKFIPECYKMNSKKTRHAILQGLLDSDGYISKTGAIEFTSASKRLAEDVLFLVQSLGGKAQTRIKKTTHLDAHVVRVALPNNIAPFRLTRKLERVVPRTKYPPRRYVDSVELVGNKECQCILVDSPDHLYITDDFIVTHNTLMAVAAGMHQTVESNRYSKVIVSRPIQAMGKDIGFLPGVLEEKMAPWIQPIKDNLLFLLGGNKNSMDTLFHQNKVEIEALTYIRGRSIPNAFIIIDECQNLSAGELKAIITRVGEGSKIVLTGDIEQIDNPYFDPMSNGLTYIVEKFKDRELSGHIKLIKGERSKLATLAAQIL
jgi:predicted ribonuclease YlaK